MSIKIWLADLTHTGQTIASDVIPAGVGMIAEVLEDRCSVSVEVRVFKFPDDLAKALETDIPDVLGVSNYVWNARLASRFAQKIKERYPATITVMGGPNCPTVSDEQELYLRENPWVDVFILKEAELAFVSLIENLVPNEMNPDLIDLETCPNLIKLDKFGALQASKRTDRMRDLEGIPSPYLSGRMDEFLDGRLLPVIQTNRGCPFSCAFCTEGQLFWSKVRRKSEATIRDEIQYIAKSIYNLASDNKRHDLLIADSNFGMFKEDLDTCRVIAETQETLGYPKYMNVATGKNKKERVLEAARIVNGAMKLAASVQSLDPTVQANMKRDNISSDQIVDLALLADEIDTNTYSEVILALPGDTLEAHFKTLQTLVDADFNIIAMYQLMILPGTEFGTDKIKAEYEMVLKYRVIPRCFGTYTLLDETIDVAEVEEICVANSTLPYANYLACRRMNLIVNLFFNDRVFGEVIKLLLWNGLSAWGWLKHIFDTASNDQFENLINAFLDETSDELWDDQDSLKQFADDPSTIAKYIDGELGSNLIFKYKALSLTEHFNCLCDAASTGLQSYLASTEISSSDEMHAVFEEVIRFKKMQIDGIFTDPEPRYCDFSFNIGRISSSVGPVSIDQLKFSEVQKLCFRHSKDQRELIESYIKIFGSSVSGLGRILSRVFVSKLYRSVVLKNE